MMDYANLFAVVPSVDIVPKSTGMAMQMTSIIRWMIGDDGKFGLFRHYSDSMGIATVSN